MAAGLWVVAAYSFGAAKYRRAAKRGYDVTDPPAPGSAEFARLVESLTGAPLRPGNRVRILRNGRQTFPAMLEAIASARTTIDFSSYFWPGDITTEFIRLSSSGPAPASR